MAVCSKVNALGFVATLASDSSGAEAYDHSKTVRYWRLNFLFSLMFFIPILLIKLVPSVRIVQYNADNNLHLSRAVNTL